MNQQESDPNRVVTSREIFDWKYLSKWRVCFRMADKEIRELIDNPQPSDILSATAQLFICWNQNEAKIEAFKNAKQESMDKRFGKK